MNLPVRARKGVAGEVVLVFGVRLLIRLKPVGDNLVLARHFFELFFGVLVPCKDSLKLTLALQSAVLIARHRHPPCHIGGRNYQILQRRKLTYVIWP